VQVGSIAQLFYQPFRFLTKVLRRLQSLFQPIYSICIRPFTPQINLTKSPHLRLTNTIHARGRGSWDV